ncbi:hypothetical protein CEXT_255611 [Caerostris extrusa]|uniref:Uncharacterized protein n=1 Tax=Caerostris extrusa TaxID=172846 RepID=A0AAV4N3K6_CAEEX|nr:hypothetical protein CEXT_255611 [Caerostris extrusa]
MLSRLDLSLCSVYWMQSGVYSYIFSGSTNGGVLPKKETDPLLYYPELLSGTFCLPEVRLFVLDPQRHGETILDSLQCHHSIFRYRYYDDGGFISSSYTEIGWRFFFVCLVCEKQSRV